MAYFIIQVRSYFTGIELAGSEPLQEGQAIGEVAVNDSLRCVVETRTKRGNSSDTELRKVVCET